MTVPLPGEAARLGWGWLLAAPWFALPGAATLLWQPPNGHLAGLPLVDAAAAGFLWLASSASAPGRCCRRRAVCRVQPGAGTCPASAGPRWSSTRWPGSCCSSSAPGSAGAPCSRDRAVPRPGWLLGRAALVLAARRAGPAGRASGSSPAHLRPEREAAPGLAARAALPGAGLCRGGLVRAGDGVARPLRRALAATGRHSLHVFCVGLFLS